MKQHIYIYEYYIIHEYANPDLVVLTKTKRWGRQKRKIYEKEEEEMSSQRVFEISLVGLSSIHSTHSHHLETWMWNITVHMGKG